MLAAAPVSPASFRPLPPFSRRGPLFLLLFLFLAFLFFAFPALTHAAAPGLYVSSISSQNIQTFDKVSGVSTGSIMVGTSPAGLAFGPDGALYIAGTGNNDILRYDPIAGTTSVFVASSAGGLNNPLGLAFGPDGNLYVSSGNGNGILRFNGTTGAFIDVFVYGLGGSYALVFGPDGNLYVAAGNNILRFNGTTGVFIDSFVSSSSGGLNGALDLAFGPDGNLYVVSANTNSILRFSGATGAFINTFVTSGSGGLNGPFAVAFGPDGNLYVSSNGGSNGNAILRFSGTTGAFVSNFANTSGVANYLAFVPVPTTTGTAMELITNGGFETGDLSGWTTFNQLVGQQTISTGRFTAVSGTGSLAGPPTVGPKTGSYYALGTEQYYATASALSQTFTVPGPAKSVILSFDMFVDDYSQNGPQINPAGLDYTVYPNQQARVDLLSPAAAPLSTAAGDVLQNFYDGVDSHAVQNPHGYTHYSFDITSLVGKGGIYTLRYALVNNQASLNQGVDNVSVQYVAAPAPPPAPLTLSVSPATVIAGTSPKLTVTLATPAPATSPNPFFLGQIDPGAYVQLFTSSPANYFYSLASSDGQVVYGTGTDGISRTYLHFNPGQTTATAMVSTLFVSTVTATTLTGQYGSGKASTSLTLTPNQVVSLTLSPASVYGGQTDVATVTLAGPAGYGPISYQPGSYAYGIYVPITSDTAGVSFPNNAAASNGSTYVFVPGGQTSATFSIATSAVTSQTTANISAALSGSTSSVSLTILPPAPTVTTLTSSVNPSVFGQPVTFAATVSSGSPTGTVTFTVDGVTRTPVTLSSGTAAYTTPALSAGTHTVTASYSGDLANAASKSAALTQTVKPAATTTMLASSANPSAFGQPVTFTAAVTSATGVTPTGVVTFSDGGIVLGTASINTQGQAVFSTARLKLGSHRITASFAANPSFAASVSAALTQQITVPVLRISAVVGTAGRDAGGSATVAVTVTNKGNVPATITVIGSALGFVPASSVSPLTLDPGASQTLTLTFPGVASGSQLFLLALSGTSSSLPGQISPFLAVQSVRVP